MSKTCNHSFVVLNAKVSIHVQREDGSYPQELLAICPMCKEQRKIVEDKEGKVKVIVL